MRPPTAAPATMGARLTDLQGASYGKLYRAQRIPRQATYEEWSEPYPKEWVELPGVAAGSVDAGKAAATGGEVAVDVGEGGLGIKSATVGAAVLSPSREVEAQPAICSSCWLADAEWAAWRP
jgi:hypothetical protein